MSLPAKSLPAKNLLGQETSPYLLQHKDNPVHWRAWGPEALAEARAMNKPILLSVGYAACHWCHVMAHESFENPTTAAVMNKMFVNIKVDREERPDIDGIYQAGLQLLGEQGGWPLTMFLTPDAEPFWGGTYFPPEAKYDRPAFIDILLKVSEVFRTQPQGIAENAAKLKNALDGMGQPKKGALVPISILDQVAERILREFDMEHGGLGSAPKFPHSSHFELIWRAYLRSNKPAYRRRRGDEPGEDEPGRHLRSSRRRLRTLCHRPEMAGAAFREDALRQRAIDRDADAGVAGDAQPPVRAARRGDRAMAGARDDRRKRGLRRHHRCRQRA